MTTPPPAPAPSSVSVLGTIGRVIWVPLAFLLATVASLFVLMTLGLERLTAFMHGRALDGGDPMPVLVEIVVNAGLLIAGLTIVPPVLLVLVGEIARIRSFLFYVAGGGLALAAIPLVAQAGTTMAWPPTGLWQVFATAGFVGGFVYWLLAGRSA